MSATHWSKFFWADWEGDEALKLCSPGAQALWMRMLCVCAKGEGYLAIGGNALTPADMVMITGWPAKDVKVWWAELKKWRVFSETGRGKVYSRRMVKEAQLYARSRDTGSKGGNPALAKNYNRPGFLYLIGPRDDGAFKVGISVNPTHRLKRLRMNHRGQDLKILATWEVEDMGASEAVVLGGVGLPLSGEWVLVGSVTPEQLKRKIGALMGAPGKKPEARIQNPESIVSISQPEAPRERAEGLKTGLPEGFPDGAAIADAAAVAMAMGATLDAPTTARRFANHALAHGRLAVDWRAAWMNWVEQQIDKAPRTAKPEAVAPVTWDGPPLVLDAVAEGKGDRAWAATFLRRTVFDPDQRRLIGPQGIIDEIIAVAGHQLTDLGVGLFYGEMAPGENA